MLGSDVKDDDDDELFDLRDESLEPDHCMMYIIKLSLLDTF